jgi:diguanylate cyclase (GGDEF)-like protein
MGTVCDTEPTVAERAPLAHLCDTLQRVMNDPAPHGLTRGLCTLLDVDAVLLAELPLARASVTATVLDGWRDGRPAAWLSYPLANTPCALTLRDGHCVQAEDVAAAWPGVVALAGDGIAGYAGQLLCDRDGVPRGLLVALSRRPLRLPEWTRQVLLTFSALALAELQRRRRPAEHDDRHELTLEFVERLHDAVAVLAVEPPLDLQRPQAGQLRHLLDHARIIAVNSRMARYPLARHVHLNGASLADLHGAETGPLVQAWLREGRPSTPHRIVHPGPDGEGTHWDCTLVPVVSKGHLVRIWATHRDVTQQVRRHDEARQLALRDPVTGLGNRSALQARLQAAATGPGTRLAVAMLDIDQFHAVNEAMSPACGDQVLQIVAARLSGWYQPGWRTEAFRLAADEFALLIEFPSTDHAPDLTSPLEQLAANLQDQMEVSQTPLSVTLAMGCAVQPPGGDDPATLLWRADLARRQAREHGLTLVQHDGSQQSQARRDDLHLRADLRQAVLEEQFVLRYQPKVRPGSGELVGFEALIRWPHPRTGRELPPAEFLPYVEATAYIHPVTHWVLDRALADLASLRSAPDVTMAVNISARNLMHTGFVRVVQAALARHRIAPERLELELTESCLLSRCDTARKQIDALAQLGVRLAIDDFGTGYSSLSYLQDLPVHTIKVDRAFVQRMGETKRSATIVRIAVELAHALGLEAVAEGVDTPELSMRLAALGYDAIQGYAIAPPLPLRDAMHTALAWHAAIAAAETAVAAA